MVHSDRIKRFLKSINIENIEDNTIIDTKIDENKIVFNLNIDKNNDYIQLKYKPHL